MKENTVYTPIAPIFKDFFDSRRNAALFAEEIEHIAIASPQKKFPWDDYNRTIYQYDKNFEGIPGQKPFICYIREGRKFVLDVMGPGFALRSIRTQLAGGVSITLACPHRAEELKRDTLYGLKVVAEHPVWRNKKRWLKYGDILKGSTWQIVNGFTCSRPFDLIVCAGEGSWKTFEKDERFLPQNTLYLPQKEIYWIVANKLWKKLSEEEGIMCLLFAGNYNWQPWIDKLKESGIDVQWDSKQAFRFTKTESSPKVLPRMCSDMSPNVFKSVVI